jgi:hypothetical protein
MMGAKRVRLFQDYLPFIPFSFGLVWLLSFEARIKEFIYDFNNYLFGCHEFDYGIHLEFYGFSSYA